MHLCSCVYTLIQAIVNFGMFIGVPIFVFIYLYTHVYIDICVCAFVCVSMRMRIHGFFACVHTRQKPHMPKPITAYMSAYTCKARPAKCIHVDVFKKTQSYPPRCTSVAAYRYTHAKQRARMLAGRSFAWRFYLVPPAPLTQSIACNADSSAR